MAVWHCREKEIEYGSKVLLMGIVNVTPDSFSDGGDWLDPATALTHARALEAQGADILDIGGQSTRPGHTPVTDKEEWARLEPVLSVLCKETALPVSVDTYYPYVAAQALRCGAQIINDVSGVVNPEMADVVCRYGAGWVIMHAGGCKGFFCGQRDRLPGTGCAGQPNLPGYGHWLWQEFSAGLGADRQYSPIQNGGLSAAAGLLPQAGDRPGQ